jgi:hypothetical protein
MSDRDNTSADLILRSAAKLLDANGPSTDDPTVVRKALEAIRVTKAWQLRRLNNWDWKELGVTVGLRVAIEETLQVGAHTVTPLPASTTCSSTDKETRDVSEVDKETKPLPPKLVNEKIDTEETKTIDSPATLKAQFEVELEGVQMRRPSLMLASRAGSRVRKRFSLSKLSPRKAFSGKRREAKFGKLKDSGVEGEAAMGTIDAVTRFSRISTDLANERTLLAWYRTALAACRTCFAVISLGSTAFGDVVSPGLVKKMAYSDDMHLCATAATSCHQHPSAPITHHPPPHHHLMSPPPPARHGEPLPSV